MATSVLSEHQTVESAIRALRGPSTTVVSRRPVGGGDINVATRLDLSDGTRLFLKQNEGRLPGLFAREADGLLALLVAGGPPVPRPLARHEGADGQWLLLEWVEPTRPRADTWEELGHALARLHRTTAPAFGFAQDNWIGSSPQPNGWLERWTDFFAERRLGAQLALLRARGAADEAVARGVERVVARLPGLLVEPERPALLHGDLWRGNVLVARDGRAFLVDPAAYYGHPEADLAMTELFGRLDARFYAAYAEAAPLAPGYAERRDLYNLYHLLNHLNLFGAGYRAAVLDVVQRYL
jgi:fructosamine-3-kinase